MVLNNVILRKLNGYYYHWSIVFNLIHIYLATAGINGNVTAVPKKTDGVTRASMTPQSSQPNIVIPTFREHLTTIIFLHGTGIVEYNWIQGLCSIRPPNVKVICPTLQSMPVSLKDNLQLPVWCHIKAEYPESSKDTLDKVEKSTEYVHGLIDTEIKKGIASDQIIISGFAQGGALALHAGLTYPKKLAGIVAYSSWLPLSESFYNSSLIAANKNTPILQGHCNNNSMVPYNVSEISTAALKRISNNVEIKRYPDLEYLVSEEGYLDIGRFINKTCPPAQFDNQAAFWQG